MALINLLSTVVLSVLVGRAAAAAAPTDAKADVLQYVNQLIGSSNGGTYGGSLRSEINLTNGALGNVFPGATLPYGKYSTLYILSLAHCNKGMAKAVADTNSGSNQGVSTCSWSSEIRVKKYPFERSHTQKGE